MPFCIFYPYSSKIVLNYSVLFCPYVSSGIDSILYIYYKYTKVSQVKIHKRDLT